MLLTAAFTVMAYLALLLYHPFVWELAISPKTYAVLRSH